MIIAGVQDRQMELTTEGFKPIQTCPVALLYGYCVYTTFCWPIAPRWLDAHLERLRHDALALGMNLPLPPEAVTTGLTGCFQPEAPIMRLTLLPEIAHYGELTSGSALQSRLLVSFRPIPAVSNGVRLQTVPHPRPMATIKHGSMADVLLHKRAARQSGFDDILLLGPNCDNHNLGSVVCESSTANVFFIRNEKLYTPDPDRNGCLPGITRLQVLEAARRLGISATDAPISPESLIAMEAAFLTNAVQGMVRVQSVDETRFDWPPESQKLFNALKHTLKAVQSAG